MQEPMRENRMKTVIEMGKILSSDEDTPDFSGFFSRVTELLRMILLGTLCPG